MSKQYLGDGVYVDFDGYALVLTTEDGIKETNRIVLEPSVYNSLKDYAEDLLHQQGRVGMAIPKTGYGEVMITDRAGRNVYRRAYANLALPEGTRIIVKEVAGDAVLVEPLS
jgi:hypothetical protein